MESMWESTAEDQQQQKKIPIKLRHSEGGKINDDDKSYISRVAALLHDSWDMH